MIYINNEKPSDEFLYYRLMMEKAMGVEVILYGEEGECKHRSSGLLPNLRYEAIIRLETQS